MQHLNAKELRTNAVDPELQKSLKKNPIYIILDNVLDTYNIGSMFRLADAVGAQKVYLCGATETPPNTRIKKASINTWQWVDWEHSASAVDAINKLKTEIPNITVFAVEQDEKSISWKKASYTFPLAIVIGNETYGCSKETLDAVDTTIELPMYGINTSLNVMVTTGIILYDMLKSTDL